jgi:hypothetical protein
MTWGKPGAKEPELGNAMEPANWDAPFILSAFEPHTIYAGTKQLWKSTDRGDTWTSLGDLTTGVDRSTLRTMGRLPNETTLSLDDGAPYYPTITEIAESPLTRGLLYVGTDDGNVQMSRDDGRRWINIANRFPGLPGTTWVSGIEASRHDANRVYVAFDGHRNDDFANYLYRSNDGGTTWSSIAGDLPPNRVIHAVHEDPKNPDLVYIATERGLYLTNDGGRHWIEFASNLPRVPVNDFVIHPRDNDLVLATHGRGVWILDDVTSLQQLTPAVLAESAHLFPVRAAQEIRYFNPRAHEGDLVFHGQNPPAGAIVDFYAREAPGPDVLVTIHDAAGATVATLHPEARAGMNRVVWNLRRDPLPAAPPDEESGGRARPIPGPLVMPGTYTVRLTVAGKTYDQPVEVKEDPRIQVSAADRQAWDEALRAAADLYRGTLEVIAQANAKKAPADLKTTAQELQSRVVDLYRALEESTGQPTADQKSQLEFYRTELDSLRKRAQ